MPESQLLMQGWNSGEKPGLDIQIWESTEQSSLVLWETNMEVDLSSFNIDTPQWDQGTFMGRLKHFFNITDPRTAIVSERTLDWAKIMVESSRTLPAVVFWQWVNQSFNALVNYTNRNAASPISVRQIAVSYFSATTTALATALGLNMYTKKAPPLLARWVPFAAVAAANCVNIPMMRQQELIHGISVTDRNSQELGRSRKAAVIGISQVVISRITMAAPGMILLPILMERLEKLAFMKKIQFLHAPLQVMLAGGFLVFMVPVACAIFPQRCEMVVSHLEPELQDSLKAKHGDLISFVYFNKGL
ncbi:sideroflexin-2 isoform X3 [Vombatus ursinus]|uniref:sideroflexin-2 isoform X3 n=1 Tax=Vombatus ursinus TaxID=29139 RepID=UPI000FFCE2E3|nr:sideroflexin-2 isoform X3 [Vombatus ursinus]